jgi:sirohydrochlorin ferrochelatase
MTGCHLLIVAHGSRRQGSNDEVRRLADQMRGLKGETLDGVEVAFLELAEPSIPDGLRSLAEKGAQHIVVLPYFLAAGTHVVNDIPDALASFESSNPGVKVSLTLHFGASSGLVAALLDLASHAHACDMPA